MTADPPVDMPTADVLLADLTTLRLGGPAAQLVRATTSDALVEAVDEADQNHTPLLVLGGGSNLVIGDDGFDGTVVHTASTGVEIESDDACSGVFVRADAGVPWDALVAQSVSEGWSGLEALSGIPGAVGATPLQNVGAYGQDVSKTIARVRTWDRVDRRIRTLATADCQFGYRDSLLKRERLGIGSRYVVLDVTFQLKRGTLSAPVEYAELARTLGVEVGQRADLAAVRETVLGLRRGKGMVLDPQDHDSWSAGSFFTNPIVSEDVASTMPESAPNWPAGDGMRKLSAAWLIDNAGFKKGYGMPGPASLSTKHTLALTNRGSAKTADLVALAREVRDGVRSAFGITLEPEPVFIGCSLD